MENYEKRGYLNSEFRLFHLTGMEQHDFEFHYHEFDKVIIFIQGDVHYTIEGKTYTLEPYDVVLVNHNELHKPTIGVSVPYERIIVYLSPSFLDRYRTPEYDLSDCFQKARKQHSSVLRLRSVQKSRMLKTIADLEQACSETDFANPLYCQLLFLEFMIQLNRAARASGVKYMQTVSANPKILELMKYINANLTGDLSIETLSKRCFLSRYHMMRLFKEETGCTINSYISDKRLLAARELLGHDVPITQVCYDCGFHNYSTFSRAYKKLFGETPQSTRKNLFLT